MVPRLRPAVDPRASVVPGLSLRLGDVLAGRYRLEDLVACEASVVTLYGRGLHGREPVVIEVLVGYSESDRANVEERIARARLAANLQGANVARVLDIGKTPDGMPYVVTSRALGPSLEEELRERGRFVIDEAVDLAMQVSAAMAEAHAHGLVHGDLEPRRIVLTTQGDGSLHATVLGFGVASAISSLGEASASAWFGSPSYIAPEQARSEAVDARADIWSVGVLLHELVSGAPPFDGESASAVLVAVAYDAAPLLTDAPYDLARIVARCLAKDPAARPQSMVELATLLAPYAADLGGPRLEGVRASAEAGRRRVARDAARGGAPRRPSPAAMIHRAPAKAESGTRKVAPRASAPPPARHERHLAPVLVDTAQPFPLVKKRDQPTLPSERLRAERRIARAKAMAVVVAAAALGVASAAWAGNEVTRAIARGLGVGAETPAGSTSTAAVGVEGPSDVVVVGRHDVEVPPSPAAARALGATAVDAATSAGAPAPAGPPKLVTPKAPAVTMSVPAPRRSLTFRAYPEPLVKAPPSHAPPPGALVVTPPPSAIGAKGKAPPRTAGQAPTARNDVGPRLFGDRK